MVSTITFDVAVLVVCALASFQVSNAVPVRTIANSRIRPRASTPSFSTEQLFGNSSAVDWEPTVACSPNGNVVMATTRYYGAKACPTCGDPSIHLRASTDGGATFGVEKFMCGTGCPGQESENDPVLAYGSDTQTLYGIWMDTWNITVSESADNGQTWNPVHNLLPKKGPSYGDKPWLTADTNSSLVVAFFNSQLPYAAASLDGGKTWNADIPLTQSDDYFFAGGAAVLSGTQPIATAGWVSYDQQNAATFWITTSTSADMTKWSAVSIAKSGPAPPCPTWAQCDNPGQYLGPAATLAADTNQNIYYLFTSNMVATTAPLAVYFTRTKVIPGTTILGPFSSPMKVTTAPANATAAFPMIAAAGNGQVSIAWMDNREGEKAWNVWYRESSDGGVSWSDEVRVSAAPAGTAGVTYKTANGFNFPFGDYGAMCLNSKGMAVMTWGEGDSFASPGGTWYSLQQGH